MTASSPRPRPFLSTLALTALALASGLSGCQSSPPEGSGFLDRYEKFEQHPDRKQALRWSKPGASLAQYDKVLMDPIAVWSSSLEGGPPAQELERLADDFQLEMYRALGKAYPLTKQPGPNVLRMRIAITNVDRAGAFSQTIRVLSGQGTRTQGVDKQYENSLIDIGAMTIEAEVLDSSSGERLFALVEKKSSGSARADQSLGSVHSALRDWAELLRSALDEAHGRTTGS